MTDNYRYGRTAIDPHLRNYVYDMHLGLCTYCGNEANPFHIDHIRPLSKGGKTVLDNLALACEECNISKGDKSLEEWQVSSNPWGYGKPVCLTGRQLRMIGEKLYGASWTQLLSRDMGVSQSHLRRLSCGNYRVTFNVLNRIQVALETHLKRVTEAIILVRNDDGLALLTDGWVDPICVEYPIIEMAEVRDIDYLH